MNRRSVLRIMAVGTMLAACPVLIGTPSLPPIEGLRARRRGGKIEVRWQRPNNLGVSTSTAIKVLPAAPGPCFITHVPHSSNLAFQTVPELTKGDMFVAASLMRGNEYISVPAILFLSRWALSAGYAKDQDDDRDRELESSYGVFGKGPVLGNDGGGPHREPDDQDMPPKPNPQPTPRPRNRGPQCQ